MSYNLIAGHRYVPFTLAELKARKYSKANKAVAQEKADAMASDDYETISVLQHIYDKNSHPIAVYLSQHPSEKEGVMINDGIGVS